MARTCSLTYSLQTEGARDLSFSFYLRLYAIARTGCRYETSDSRGALLQSEIITVKCKINCVKLCKLHLNSSQLLTKLVCKKLDQYLIPTLIYNAIGISRIPQAPFVPGVRHSRLCIVDFASMFLHLMANGVELWPLPKSPGCRLYGG